MRAIALELKHELIGLAGVVERNVYLTRRYIYWDLAFFVWTVANTLTIVFIAEGIESSGGDIDVDRVTTTLLIGAVVWAYLGIIFEFLTETVAWERWEGTIEYTFMAPLSRAMHLGGSGVFAVIYGLVRAILLFIVVAAFFGLQFEDANFVAALVILIVASISFFGIGMMTAVLPLISPEKGAQLGFVAQGMLLVVSGVYYPVEVLPQWMQWIATISPATYALEGIRAAILDGASLGSLWHDIWPLADHRRGVDPARPLDLQPGRGVREAARQAEEEWVCPLLMGIEIRVAETDDEFEAWRQVRIAVLPYERCASVEWMRKTMTPERVYLLAMVDGVVAGSGLSGRSDFGYAGLHPRVLPAFRRRGVGTALLQVLAAHAVDHGFEQAGTNVDDPGSLAFAERLGAVEVDRQIEQVRDIGAESIPVVPDWLEIVSVAERPELWAAAYDPLALQAFADMATYRPVIVTREQWERDWLAWPEGMLLGLVDGGVVGCAGLERDDDDPLRAENALTAVLRARRGRGIATALKSTTLAFAAEHGIRQIYTWTQTGNEDMRALNERLGYRYRNVSITVRADLPNG